MDESWRCGLTLLWFTLTYAGLALGKVPGLRMDRTGIALVGAALVLATGLLRFEDAVRAVDFATLALLLGMMIVVAFLRTAGLFERVASWALARVHTPRGLLAATMALSGLLSALLVNDVVCLALTPLVLQLTRHWRIDPRPQLIGLALAANIGSTATLTGNPQNMIIGGLSHLAYARFAAKLAPVAALGLVVAYGIVAWLCRAALQAPPKAAVDDLAASAVEPARTPRTRLLVKSLLVTLTAVVLFFAGEQLPVVALGAAAVLLVGRVHPDKIYRQIDWGLLLLFAGLFVVVRAFEVHVLRRWGLEHWQALQDSPIGLLSVLAAVLSNLVSNVPAVLLFHPVIPQLPPAVRETAWLALAMSSTLAGNLTVLGSVANLIVVESARRAGVAITFWDYAKVGVPVTLVTLLLGAAWLQLLPY